MGYMTLSLFDALLKENYEGAPQYALNNLLPFYQRAKKKFRDIENVGGKSMQVRFPIITKRNHGIGARDEYGDMPTAGNISSVQAACGLKYLYGSIALTGQSISASKDKKHSFAEALDLEMKMMEEGLVVDFARQIHGDGSGTLAQINGSGTNTTTFVVDNPDTRWMEPGMVVDVYDAKTSGSASHTNLVVTDVDRVNSSIILSAAATIANNYYFVRAGSYGKELTGLGAVLDDGTVAATIYGFTRATAGYNFTKASLISNSAGALTDLITQQAVQDPFINHFAGQGGATIALCDHQSLRWHAKLQQSKTRFVNNIRLPGGFSSVTYTVGDTEVEFFADRFAWPGYTMFLKEDVFEFAYAPEANWKWMDRDGAVLRKISSKDAYEATIYAYCNLICRNIATQVRLYNYTAPA